MNETLYFAYGSNLDQQQMRKRCPGARVLAPGVLRGYRIAFGNHSVKRGGAVATIVPYPRHYPRKFEADLKNLNENPKLYQQYIDWRNDRLAFNEQLQKEGSEAQKEGWQRTYMKGQDQSGNVFAGHETKIQMKDFKRS